MTKLLTLYLQEAGFPARVVPVATLEEASRRVVAFADDLGLGASDMGERHGLVATDCKITHRVAYNGTVLRIEVAPLAATPRPSQSLVTTVTSQVRGAHSYVSVWIRGGLAGELVVEKEDGPQLAARLLPDAADVVEHFDAAGRYARTVKL